MSHRYNDRSGYRKWRKNRRRYSRSRSPNLKHWIKSEESICSRKEFNRSNLYAQNNREEKPWKKRFREKSTEENSDYEISDFKSVSTHEENSCLSPEYEKKTLYFDPELHRDLEKVKEEEENKEEADNIEEGEENLSQKSKEEEKIDIVKKIKESVLEGEDIDDIDSEDDDMKEVTDSTIKKLKIADNRSLEQIRKDSQNFASQMKIDLEKLKQVLKNQKVIIKECSEKMETAKENFILYRALYYDMEEQLTNFKLRIPKNND